MKSIRKVIALFAVMLGLVWLTAPSLRAADDTDASTTTADVKKKAKKTKKKAKAKKDEAVAEVKATAEDTTQKTEDTVVKKTRKSKKKAKETAEAVESKTSAAASNAENTAAAAAAPVAAAPAAATAATEKAVEPAKSSASSWMSNLGKKKETATKSVSDSHHVEGKLDLNTATSDELQAAGLSSSAAQKIIGTRPFTRKDELKKKGILTDDEYEKVKEGIIAHTAKN